MSQLKAKQLKLSAAGDLLIGGTGGTGAALTVGASGKVLKSSGTAPAWSDNDNIESANGFNSVTATDDTGVTVAVQNSDASAATTLATFTAGPASDEAFAFSSAAGAVTIAATGSTANVDLILAAQGTGDVVIGSEGGGIIQADDGEDLQLLGGTGSGNLLLNGGGTGKVYYGSDSSDATLEVATVGGVTTAVNAAKLTPARKEFAGDATFTLDANTVADSIIAYINGILIEEDYYVYTAGTQTIAFTGGTDALPYDLDSVDQVVFTYETSAAA